MSGCFHVIDLIGWIPDTSETQGIQRFAVCLSPQFAGHVPGGVRFLDNQSWAIGARMNPTEVAYRESYCIIGGIVGDG